MTKTTKTHYRIASKKPGAADFEFIPFTGSSGLTRERLEERMATETARSDGWEFRIESQTVVTERSEWRPAGEPPIWGLDEQQRLRHLLYARLQQAGPDSPGLTNHELLNAVTAAHQGCSLPAVERQLRLMAQHDIAGSRKVPNTRNQQRWKLTWNGSEAPQELLVADTDISEQMLDDARLAYEAQRGLRNAMIAALTAANIWGEGQWLDLALRAYRSGYFGKDASMRDALAAVMNEQAHELAGRKLRRHA